MVTLKTNEEIEIMAEAGRRLAEVLRLLKKEARAGVSTKYLDELAFRFIKEREARPAFFGYSPAGSMRPYPHALCASLNDGVVHGLPSDKSLKEGDILKLDLGLIYKNLYVDAAETIAIGRVNKEALKLIDTTREALSSAIKMARPGNCLGDVGFAVQSLARKRNFSVVKVLTGHGIGHHLHEDPAVFNFGKKGIGMKLKAGMVLAIEPMITTGSEEVNQLEDDSFVTADGSMAAHFEHTVAVTEKGPRVLTE